MFGSPFGAMRTVEEHIAYLERRIALFREVAIAHADFLAAAHPTSRDEASRYAAALVEIEIQDMRETLEFLKAAPPQTPWGYGTPTFTAEDLIRANEDVQAGEAAMEAAERIRDQTPESLQPFIDTQLLPARRVLEAAIEHRDMIQKAIEQSEQQSK